MKSFIFQIYYKITNLKLTLKSNYQEENYIYSQSQDVPVEKRVIFQSYTVIDPLAMMVKSLNTSIANITMSWLSSWDNFTSRTQYVRIKFLNHFQKAHPGLFLQIPWIFSHTQNKEDICENEHSKQGYQQHWGINT